MANPTIKPAISAIQKVSTRVPAPKKPKDQKSAKLLSTSPLFGQKKSRPSVQSVPTRTPSF